MWTVDMVDKCRGTELSDGRVSIRLSTDEFFVLFATAKVLIGQIDFAAFQRKVAPGWRPEPYAAPIDMITVDSDAPNIFTLKVRRGDNFVITYQMTREEVREMLEGCEALVEDSDMGDDDDDDEEEEEEEEDQ